MGSLSDQLYRPLHGLGVDRERGEAEGLNQDTVHIGLGDNADKSLKHPKTILVRWVPM